MLSAREIMEKAVEALDGKKAQNITVLKTDNITVLADYFVICTAGSSTHVKSLTDEVDRVLSELGEPPLRREGYRSSSWILVDFGCVVVHIFLDEARKFYGLERLWSDAQPVDVSALLKP